MPYDEFNRIDTDNSPSQLPATDSNEESLDWAKEFYAKLKKKQEEEKAKLLEDQTKQQLQTKEVVLTHL